MGTFYATGSHFQIESPNSYASVLGELLWRQWDGICAGGDLEVPVDDLVAGRAVHFTACDRLGARDVDVWVDRETSLVLRAEATEAGATLPGWGGLQRLLPGADFEFVEVEFDPTFDTDAFTLVAPVGASVSVEPETSDFDPDPVLHPMVGSPAPGIVGDLLDGGAFDLADLRGRRVAVLFWASWCDPCLDMLGAFQAYVDDETPQFEVVAVAYIDELAAARRVVADGPITLPVVDGSDWSSSDFEDWFLGIPTGIFIDEFGTVVAVHAGVDPVAEVVEHVGWVP
jgi:thiol-disulfide isomerase/thioredoxin